MILRNKCNFYTAVTVSFFLLLGYYPVASEPVSIMEVNMQGDTTQVDTTNQVVINTVSAAQEPARIIKRDFAKLPEKLIKDEFNCLQNAVPLKYNKVSKNIINSFLTRDRSFIAKMLDRKQIYFPIFEEALQRYGLPDELKYLSIVESALNPKAVSRVKAVGLWQFMSATGRQYKLHQDIYIDERMDPYKATEAACQYLKDLHGMFNDWELALAAYNCGPGNVRRAIRRSGNKRNFWQIYNYLPQETRSYVPKFIAINYLMQHAENYNITNPALINIISSDTILVNQSLNLGVFAKQINVSLEDLHTLNPQIKRNIIPGYLKNYCLRIPSEKKELFVLNRTGILQLASINKSGNAYSSSVSIQDNLAGSYTKTKIIYTIKPGDVIGKIADRYQVHITDIQRWNQLTNNVIQTGQTLVIYKQVQSSEKNRVAVNTSQLIAASGQEFTKRSILISPIKIYFVQPGDTLSRISEIYGGVSVEKIKKINKMTTNELKPGQKIFIG